MNCDTCMGCGQSPCCNGCPREGTLSPWERELLDRFSVTPFLPVVSDGPGDELRLPDPELDPRAAGAVLRLLERRGLVTIDRDLPLAGADYAGYETWRRGSAALTARGQQLWDDLQYGG